MSTTSEERTGTPVARVRALVRRHGFVLSIVLALVLGGMVMALASSRGADIALDPTSAHPDGAKALATLLRDQGVAVDQRGTLSETLTTVQTGTTILVAAPWRLSSDQLDRLRDSPADLVLVAPTARELRVAPDVEIVGADSSNDGVQPGTCAIPAGARAGEIDSEGLFYTSASATCYQGEFEDDTTGSSLIRTRDTGPGGVAHTVTVLGAAGLLTNDRLDDRGNASLALSLLGERPRLVWYLPTAADAPSGGQASLSTLLPAGVKYGAGMLVLAVVVLGLWRGRRFGPIVVEPLPVVVRASETTEGRARLYRRARARDRAADILREGARERLRVAVGLERHYSPTELIGAVAARSQASSAEVSGLLGGPPPPDDKALVGLVDLLHRLEKEVTGS